MKKAKYIGMVIFGIAFCCTAGWGQNYIGAPPAPLITSSDQSVATGPDLRPLTGMQLFTLGAPAQAGSYLLPSVTFSQYANMNGGSDVNSVSSLSWNIALERMTRTGLMSANYTGGALFNTDQAMGNSHFHQFGAAQMFQFRRWTLNLMDQFSYLPESSFGYGYGYGYTGLEGSPTYIGSIGIPGQPGANLTPSVVPDQSIFTNSVSRVSNVAAAQADFMLGERSSVTASGSFGLLHFLNANSLNSHQANVQLGFNHYLTQSDAIGVAYDANIITYGGLGAGRRIGHNFLAAYGRRVTGRLAWQLSGGPQINKSDQAAAGPSSLVPTGPSRFTSWTLFSGLRYQLSADTAATFGYYHGITSGSGIFLGSSGHAIQGSIGRPLTRTITGRLDAGYSHNSGLNQLIGTVTSNSFSSEYVRVGIDRPIGQQATINFNYELQHQSTDSSVCAGPVCGFSFLGHMVGVGITWRMNPILVRR